MILPVHLFLKIALEDKSGRVHFLLAKSIPLYARFIKQNKSTTEQLSDKFKCEIEYVYQGRGFLHTETYVSLAYLPSKLLHGPSRTKDMLDGHEHDIVYFLGRIKERNCNLRPRCFRYGIPINTLYFFHKRKRCVGCKDASGFVTLDYY